MNDPTRKIRRLDQLPQQIEPPRDGWPALEAKLREHDAPHLNAAPAAPRAAASGRYRQLRYIAAVLAVVSAVLAGALLDRWMLRPATPTPHVVAASRMQRPEQTLPVAYVTDPRYLREHAALLRSLDARLNSLPPPTRRKLLQSLATLEQSATEIRTALGQEPGNALLQSLLIDTYQDQMQLLSTAQEMGGAGHEAST